MLPYIVLTLWSIYMVNADCPAGCNQPTAIYEDLRCKPIYEKPTDCCPKEYDCSNLAKRNPNKCTYRGTEYAVGDKIPKENTYGNCKIGCYCQAPETINCAILDCPEWLGVKPKKDQHYIYEHDKCCSVGEKAAPYATCKVGEETYKEGQRFNGPTRCSECICGKKFTGKFEAPFCVNKTCVEEMRSISSMKANCAPSYFGEESCCPFNWICPTDEKAAKDEFTPAAAVKHADRKCKYGSKTLNFGDRLMRIEPISEYDKFEIKCECIIPPWLTCTRKQVFDLEKTPAHIKAALNL